MIEKYYPEHELAFEAGYWKVYCFYLLEDKGLAACRRGLPAKIR